VCITTNQPDTNPNPDPKPNPITKQHAMVNIQQIKFNMSYVSR